MPKGGKRNGAGNKPIYSEEVIQVSLVLPVSVLAKLRAESSASNKSVASILRGFIPSTYFSDVTTLK